VTPSFKGGKSEGVGGCLIESPSKSSPLFVYVAALKINIVNVAVLVVNFDFSQRSTQDIFCNGCRLISVVPRVGVFY